MHDKDASRRKWTSQWINPIGLVLHLPSGISSYFICFNCAPVFICNSKATFNAVKCDDIDAKTTTSMMMMMNGDSHNDDKSLVGGMGEI
jgi:hypothetical protein